MKFTVQSDSISNCKMRLGQMSEFKRLPNTVLLTPLLLLYTKGGSVTHLTREVLDLVTNISTQAMQIPLANSLECHNGMQHFKQGISGFVGLSECLSYCSVQDPAELTKSGYNDKNSITIWTQTGRKQLTADKYMDSIEAFRPDLYHALCDGDTGPQTSRKRVQKAVDVTTKLFLKCAERHTKSQTLQDSGSSLLAVVEGGYKNDIRRQASMLFAKHPQVAGFVIDGLHSNGADVENIKYETIKPIITRVLEHLPANKPRFVHGGWRPDVVLDLVQAGVDVFDSSLVYLASQRGCALSFTYTSTAAAAASRATHTNTGKCNGVTLTNGASDTCHNKKLEKEDVKCEKDENKPITKNSKFENSYELNLHDKKYFDDLTPLSASCSCLTCSKHTKAYIHHLLNTKEMLASVLLTIHNLHHYQRFFEAIRETGERGELLKVDPPLS